ncbi:MAG: hypothetical protein NUV80_02415 [Candidatus Berkelbacteria bacterium]|nr:hypothetical protein [Candidatus Berkelbacteria bacterium]
MQISTITKVVVGFAFGAVIGGGVISTISNLNYSTDQLSTELAYSTIVSQTNSPPMPPCPPPPEPQTNCMTPEQYQMWQQAQQQQPPQQPPPTNNQFPDPNQQQQNNTQNGQPPPPTNNQFPDPNQQQNGQTGQPNPNQQPPNNGQYPPPPPGSQPGQPFQPQNTASHYQGPPPNLNLSFQQPAGLQDPDKCFREKGGEALVAAVRSGQMTPGLMSQAASCFVGNFNNGGGPGGPGQGGPNGSGGPGQNGQPFGQMAIFSGDFIKTMSNTRPPAGECVAKIAGADVAEKMFGQGIQPDSATRDKIFQAGCFGPPPGGAGQPGPNGQPGAPGRQFAGPPPEVVECLNKIAGNGDIQSGKRAPTPTEFNAGQSCYAKANAVPFFVPPHEVPENSPLALCAKAVIGVTDLSSITPNSLTRDQKQRMRQCYAPSGEQAMANTQPSLPQEAADCIKKIMGEEAFAQVSTGRLEPTAEQRKAGAICFKKSGLSKIAELSVAAVPKTQAEALMADVDSTLVPEPEVVAPTTTEVAENPDEASFELTGTLGGEADVETVDVYYNSDANIVTTETKDENGKKTWSTKVAYSSLSQDEDHTLYALMTKSDGTVVRSPLVAFAAKAADSTETTSTSGTNRNMMVLYGILGALALAIIGFVLVRRRHKTAA